MFKNNNENWLVPEPRRILPKYAVSRSEKTCQLNSLCSRKALKYINIILATKLDLQFSVTLELPAMNSQQIVEETKLGRGF